MASREAVPQACGRPEAASFIEAMKEVARVLQCSGYRSKEIATLTNTSRPGYYKRMGLRQTPSAVFLWRLYREARYGADLESKPGRSFGSLALLLFEWSCTEVRGKLVAELRKEKRDLEREASGAPQQADAARQLAELEQAIEDLERGHTADASAVPTGVRAGAESSERVESVAGDSEVMVAPVPPAEGDRRNQSAADLVGAVPTADERADIDTARGHWRAGRLPDALLVARAIATGHSAESLLAFVDSCKAECAESLLESFLADVAWSAEADTGRALKTVRLFLDAGYRHEAISIEADVSSGS
ncbi:hypothetical protein [Streptomonospora litoralis]|uniref:Uncharacterized protein n=1 Tax=Streptomonospora litoralis TaxID=2498135 RepID=A0A4V0ZKA4_9ACTN|nr:hypothetical protein [Streptomonospora litoralis]QBI56292.1 hypothetical protein EKD16_22695 [Streptomonospora litoralis]